MMHIDCFSIVRGNLAGRIYGGHAVFFALTDAFCRLNDSQILFYACGKLIPSYTVFLLRNLIFPVGEAAYVNFIDLCFVFLVKTKWVDLVMECQTVNLGVSY